MKEFNSDQSLDPHRELRAILTNPRAYPLELNLADGRKLRIVTAKFVRFPPRMKSIVYFPPKVSDGFVERISPDQVIGIRVIRKKRAA